MKAVVASVRKKGREKRKAIFRETFHLGPNTSILDLGGHNGTHINYILQGSSIQNKNIYLADINHESVREGQEKYGYTPVFLNQSFPIPFEDCFFDIVFCSSVIEHVTGKKQKVLKQIDGKAFRQQALNEQRTFANEIIRIGKGYFVQTPYKWFPIESHTQLPCVGYLPRRVLVRLLSFSNKFWIKKTQPDWYLLTKKELSDLFPKSLLKEEKFLGFTKSIIAIRKE